LSTERVAFEIRKDGEMTVKCLRDFSSCGKPFFLMDDQSDDTDCQTEAVMGLGLMLVTLMILCLGMLLVWFAILRENQVFWTNAGGYPVWLRDLVCWTYLPLFAMAVVCLSVGTVCLPKVSGSIRFFVVEILVLLLCWGLLAASAYIALDNNIRNLIEGREFHHHDH
jgi:hypothetical protein